MISSFLSGCQGTTKASFGTGNTAAMNSPTPSDDQHMFEDTMGIPHDSVGNVQRSSNRTKCCIIQ